MGPPAKRMNKGKMTDEAVVRPGKGPPPKAKEVATNFGYTGPLRFNQPNRKFCFHSGSVAGCPKGPSCIFASSHGLCPLPRCNGAKHVCEIEHPEVWAPFAAALASSSPRPRH